MQALPRPFSLPVFALFLALFMIFFAVTTISFVVCASNHGYIDDESSIICHLLTLMYMANVLAPSVSHHHLFYEPVVQFSLVARSLLQTGTRRICFPFGASRIVPLS